MIDLPHVYLRWLRDRMVSTIVWIVGIVVIVVLTAAFYPSMSGISSGGLTESGAGMSALMGLGPGIDPTAPLGYLWIGLYANVYPWMLMGLGVVLGVAAIAGDEDTGALEYLLATPVTRSAVTLARFAGTVTILALAAIVSGLSLIVCIPLFDLDQSVTTTGANGASVTSPGATATDVFNGTLSSFAIGLGLAGVAFLLGTATGRKGLALGVATAIGVGGYVIYTLASTTDSLEWMTWFSPWRWYVADAMLVKGLTWNVLWPFLTATVGLLLGWWVFLRRDLRSP
jgi:ABC-2 type transport system permease protein